MGAVLALLAAAAVAQPRDVAPVTVTAQPRTAPPADASLVVGADPDAVDSHGVSIWPRGALAARAKGTVTLTCRVDVHGLAEACRVAFEEPQGRGFGAAALALRPTFKLTPRLGPDGPIDSTMNIAVEFRPPDTQSNLQAVMAAGRDLAPEGQDNASNQGGHELNGRDLRVYGNPIVTRGITMMTAPAWEQAPGFGELEAAYPAAAGGVEGYAVAHCKVEPTGLLSRCKPAKEAPAGHGFGKAAVDLAARFRVAPEMVAQAPRGAPVEVDVPVRFPAPGEARDRTVWSPTWVAGLDPEAMARAFPAEAAAKGVADGEAVLRCQVTAGGGLSGCEVERARPDGLGFDEAALKLAPSLKMNLWSAEAGPVEGGVVHVPIRLERTTTP
jgi:TonB family protein